MPKNTGLKLFTKTWPPKRDTKKKDNARPLTATLDKPAVLDIKLIGIIDMSTVRKEFLNISNLCRFPISLAIPARKKNSVKQIAARPLSLPATEKHLTTSTNSNKVAKLAEDNSWDEESCSVQSARNTNKVSKQNFKVVKASDKLLNKIKNKSGNNKSDANNNKTFTIPRKRVGNVAKLPDLKNDIEKSTKLPEPCKTCGRPDQPERFHSHPATPSMKAAKKPEDPPKMKSTVQKPVAIKYKSKVKSESNKTLTPRRPSLPAQKLVHTPPNIGVPQESPSSTGRIRSAKRTLTCYICGREFGTASLPLHEPKCLEKWERENASLPVHLRRKFPVKPDHPLTQEEWNQFAWESSQSTLTPCVKCGRTFFPDRLAVHQRSCKAQNDHSKPTPLSPSPSLATSPPNTECYICGKLFGKHSIKIHEKQCLKKWQTENDSLPSDMRAPEPINNKRDNALKTKINKNEESKEGRVGSAKKPPMSPCYICGRLFTLNSISIHEPQCLKMWKIENDKLPLSKRRPQPLKPDIRFTHDGKIDLDATIDASWQSHLSQLIPCKFCSRTFNPDRVEVHEKSCKGQN